MSDLVLKPKPKPEFLLDVTMRVLAEEEALESILERGEAEENIKNALEKVKRMKKSLLGVYFSLTLLGTFKHEFIPATAALGGRREWLLSQRVK